MIDKDAEEIGDLAVAIISSIRQYKNRRGLALNASVELLTIECDDKLKKRLERVFEDIKGTVKIKDITFGKGEILIENYPVKLKILI